MNKKCTCRFGHGYRALDREQCFSAKCFNPAVVENEITLEVDNVDLFRIEQVEHIDPSESYIRVRSDISMLFHAEATAKKIGTEGFRSFLSLVVLSPRLHKLSWIKCPMILFWIL